MAKTNNLKKTVKKAVKTAVKKTAAAPRSTTSGMKTSEIRDLIDFISGTGLNEVNIETSELKLHVKREPDQKILKSSAPTMMAAAPAVQATAPAQIARAEKPAEVAPESTLVEVRSPMIGTFYRSANPDTPSFVNVGDRVEKGQIVCIIEAMKLFNEIESEVSGTVVKILAENATPVEYDQVLYMVEPD